MTCVLDKLSGRGYASWPTSLQQIFTQKHLKFLPDWLFIVALGE